MFGHAFKGQVSGKKLLKKFKSGGGTLYDIEYLTQETEKRIAAFGYWAGFVGAFVTLKVWISQNKKKECGPLTAFSDKNKLLEEPEQNSIIEEKSHQEQQKLYGLQLGYASGRILNTLNKKD